MVPKKTHHTCVFKKKTSFSFLKSRLKKADILGYFHLFPAVTIPNYYLLSSQLIHITHTRIQRSHRRSICTRKAQLTVKSERLIFSRACEGERRARILYLIWHLFTRLFKAKGSRVIANSKNNYNSLAQWRERRSCDEIPRNRYDSIVFVLFFFFCLQSAEDARETKSVRDAWSCQPICQSKCPFKNLRSRKKRREDFKGRR